MSLCVLTHVIFTLSEPMDEVAHTIFAFYRIGHGGIKRSVARLDRPDLQFYYYSIKHNQC